MKELFNWLGKKSDVQPTLGYALFRPVLGNSNVNEVLYNTFSLRNGGRLTERAIFLSTVFGAAAVLPLSAPLAVSTVFLLGASALAGKTAGIIAGKVTDWLVADVNLRVIPRREAQKAPQKQP